MVRPIALLLIASLPALAVAQTHPLVKRTVLSGENPQVFNRLQALDRQAAFLWANSAAASLLGLETPALALVLDQGEKWDQILEDYLQLIQEYGDVLAPREPIRSFDAVPPPSVQVRRLVQQASLHFPLPSAKSIVSASRSGRKTC